MPLMGPGRRVARRRVVGAAAIGGAAYYAGKKGAEADAGAAQEPMPEAREAQEPPAPAEADYVEELKELAKLHEQGVIDDEEFAGEEGADPRDLGATLSRASARLTRLRALVHERSPRPGTRPEASGRSTSCVSESC